jgi:hypothetical protein
MRALRGSPLQGLRVTFDAGDCARGRGASTHVRHASGIRRDISRIAAKI